MLIIGMQASNVLCFVGLNAERKKCEIFNSVLVLSWFAENIAAKFGLTTVRHLRQNS
jgi:hypothetical protein